MRAISSSVGRHSYVVSSGEKNGTLHGMGEDCPAGHVDDAGQGIGLFQGFCQIYKCEDGYNFFHTCKFKRKRYSLGRHESMQLKTINKQMHGILIQH